MKPHIIKQKCPAMGDICKAIPACPNQVVSYVADENEPLGGKIEVDDSKCTGCGICAEECCGTAIEMTL